MVLLIQILVAAITGQTPPQRIMLVPPRAPTPHYPIAPPVPPAPPQPPAPPFDLPIAKAPKPAQLASGADGHSGLAKIGVRIDGKGRVTDCTPLMRDTSGALEAAACRLAAVLRFRKPPAGATGPLPIGVRYTGTSAEIVRATAGTSPRLDLSQPFVTDEDYPPTALRAAAEGRSVVRARVSPQGRATDCLIIGPSGRSDLDDATCHAAMRARYLPARDGFGDAVAGWARVPIVWKLPIETPSIAAPPPPGK